MSRMPDWLFVPIDPSRPHEVGALLAWHARLMVLAWGGVVPLAVLAARFFKVTPWQDWPGELDNKSWWHVHRGGQSLALGLMAVGLVLVLWAPAQSAGLHRLLGATALGLAGVQYVSGWLRGSKGGPTDARGMRGDHYDMTRRRRLFEAVHKTGGYLAVAAGLAAMLSGLWLANAPVWMWLVLGGWWSLLLAAAVVLSQRYPRAKTYQAIWGPDPQHPGNR